MLRNVCDIWCQALPPTPVTLAGSEALSLTQTTRPSGILEIAQVHSMLAPAEHLIAVAIRAGLERRFSHEGGTKTCRMFPVLSCVVNMVHCSFTVRGSQGGRL